MSVASNELAEQKAYEAMISLFYGKIFGIVPSYILEKIEKTYKETGKDFNTHCVEEEGWDNIEQVYDFASIIKRMPKEEREEFMTTCPSELLKVFVTKELNHKEVERIFKEDAEQQEKKLQAELLERQLKRKAVFDKHEAVLKLAATDEKGKQMRWRRHFYSYVKMLSTKVFRSEDEEYELVGKPDRLRYTDSDMIQKAYTKKDPMHNVILDIVTEYGCFDY